MNSNHMVIGILAHVDAGKTTLSESLLFLSGKIRRQGRVDHQDAYLDTSHLEKERGITIFSKQAELSFGDLDVTLLDTPGHADFSPEMERVLQVLDYAILVISAPDGVTGQVRVLWNILEHYQVPTFIFVNKMDQPGMSAPESLEKIRKELTDHAVDFSGLVDGDLSSEKQQENLAVCDETLLEAYLETGKKVETADMQAMISRRQLFPVYFGSALKNEGVEALIDGIETYGVVRSYPETFGARVFKISRDDDGNRLTWIKVTGGCVTPKMILPSDKAEKGEERKIDQIRVYSGDSFTACPKATPGMICAVTGLTDTKVGEGLGYEQSHESHLIQPVFTRSILFDEGQDRTAALRNLRMLEEEDPMLHITADEDTGEISAQIMGEVETEILQKVCEERFHMKISFGPAQIVYMETIAEPVEGVGHYEPLRHYAEVHLLLEPTGPGSGLTFAADCSLDMLARNWQRLILTHLMEKKHRGVLTGSPITDMRITLIGGRASEKHTVGGDFRQATYRAVRQGLMSAQNILLEPWYDFSAEIPQENIGRLLSDIQRMEGTSETPGGDGQTAIIRGTVPAAEAGSYAAEVRAYTHGRGRITLTFRDYEPARHPEEIILQKGYDPEADLDNSPDSVFCSHGAGMLVPWQLVREYMHVDTGWRPNASEDAGDYADADAFSAETAGENGEGTQSFSSGWRKDRKKEKKSWADEERERAAGEEELKNIFERTFGESTWHTKLRNEQNEVDNTPGIWSKDGSLERAEREKEEKNRAAGRNGGTGKAGQNAVRKAGQPAKQEDYLLVDGYNIIFSWEELRDLASRNIDAARDKLIDILSNYQGTRSGSLILVFDAYKVPGGQREIYHYPKIDVVYTKEAETADTYIVKTAHTLKNKGHITVATSDGIVQMIIFGEGARRMSARELEEAVRASERDIRENWHTKN